MITYVLLNTVFAVAVGITYLVARKRPSMRAIIITLAAVVGLTAFFDPIMIAVGLVEYDSTKLLGVYWFGAPIEDFAYAIFAVFWVAILWHCLEPSHEK